MPAQTKITLKREKECKHSVRFKAEAGDPNNPPAVDTVYVSRQTAGINDAQEITVTVEIS